MSPVLQYQRDHWFALLKPLNTAATGHNEVVPDCQQKVMLRSRAYERIRASVC